MAKEKSDKITKDTVRYVAHLARIELKTNELTILAKQLEDILEFINKLKQVDIDNARPTTHILPIQNVFREDKQHPCLSIEEALKNAPQRKEDFFGVPKVIE